MRKNSEQTGTRKPYRAPRLRRISLATDEVLGGGCKDDGISINAAGQLNGCGIGTLAECVNAAS